MKPPTHCRHGHPWNASNTRHITTKSGRTYRQCRRCATTKVQLRYRHDAQFRDAVRARAKASYWRRKAQPDNHA